MEEEKRIAPRILFDSSVRYHEKGAQKYSNAIGKDISNNGIGFISDEFLSKYSKLVFYIHPPGQPEPIQALAEVIWVSNQPYSERFNAGARFLNPIMPNA